MNEEYNLETAKTMAYNFEIGLPGLDNNMIRTYYNPLAGPYVAKTEYWLGRLEISALNVCQGARKEINELENNNCLAQQFRFRRGRDDNYFLAVDNFSSGSWSGLSLTNMQVQKTPDNQEIIVIDNYHQGKSWDSWRKDFFDLQGEYIGSYNSELSSVVLSNFKPVTFPVIPNYDDQQTPTIRLATSPSWEDRQIIEELAKKGKFGRSVHLSD